MTGVDLLSCRPRGVRRGWAVLIARHTSGERAKIIRGPGVELLNISNIPRISLAPGFSTERISQVGHVLSSWAFYRRYSLLLSRVTTDNSFGQKNTDIRSMKRVISG